MVDKIHSQNNIFLIGITHRSALFLSKIILIQISLSKNAQTQVILLLPLYTCTPDSVVNQIVIF
jgi:hypothetical protein